VCRLLGLLRAGRARLLGLSRSCGCLLLAATLGLGGALDLRLGFVVLLLGCTIVVVGPLLLELQLMRLLDNGLATLRQLDGWVGFVTGLLELVAFVACGGDVVRLDLFDGGFGMATAPGPAGCIYMSVRV